MKLLIIHTLYPAYIRSLYENNAELANESYSFQKEKIDMDAFAWCGVWEKPFERLGWTVEAVYENVPTLQNVWAFENETCKDVIAESILDRQISKFKPDLIFVDDVFKFNNSWIIGTKKKFPYIRSIFGYICSPSYVAADITKFDFIFTCLHSIKKELLKLNIQTEYLPHAFNSDILKRIPDSIAHKSEICFYGGFVRGANGHGYRESVLIDVLNNGIDMHMFSDISNVSTFRDFITIKAKKTLFIAFSFLKRVKFLNAFITKFPYYSRVSTWGDFKSNVFDRKLKSIVDQPKYGLALFQTILDYQCVLNIHGDLASFEAANMRMFEVTGMGRCLITDWKPNLHQFFIDGEEVLSFKTSEECIEKINWVKNNPEKANMIAKAGQLKTLTVHNFDIRAKVILETLNVNGVFDH